MTRLLINNIKIALDDDEKNALTRAKQILIKQKIDTRDFEFSVYKKSIDARNKNSIFFVYTVLATSPSNVVVALNDNIRALKDVEIDFERGVDALCGVPVVVGMGPAGMFCALFLAENGYRPIIIDRGDSVEDRVKAIEKFFETGILDTESNVQFGAGGAGTFSDGKLTTRINDSMCNYVLERFVEFGAPSEILTKSKPHIGTDILTKVVQNILVKIEELGGQVIYRCRMDDINFASSDGIEVITTKGAFKTNALVLALGHSARDTYRMLLSHNLVIEPKSYSVGVRVEHLQKDIDVALYGKYAGHPKLGVGEYNLSDTNGRGVYTFCMCPGGEVVAATSMEQGVCVNGMSKFARDGVNANCAVNVSVDKSDYGNNAYKAIEFQENLERRAYLAAGGNYFAPIQLMGDFLEDKVEHMPSRILPTYAGGKRTTVTNLGDVLPCFVTQRLKEGFCSFDRKINGFAVADAVLTGIETRTSAPIRIMRNEKMCAISQPFIYPCGEGAGYAGGIMSSAVDGLKVATEIIKKYKPL